MTSRLFAGTKVESIVCEGTSAYTAVELRSVYFVLLRVIRREGVCPRNPVSTEACDRVENRGSRDPLR